MTKRFLSLLLSMILLLTLFVPVVAIANDEKTQTLTKNSESETVTAFPSQKYEEYVSAMKEQYLNVVAFNTDVDRNACAVYSQGYEILNDDDPYNRIYFLFVNDLCIGELTVTYENKEFASSFLPEELPEVSQAFKDQKEFALYSYKNTLVYCDNNNAITLYGENKGERLLQSEFNELKNSKDYSNKKYVIIQDSQSYTIPVSTNIETMEADVGTQAFGSTLTANYGMLDVPYVANSLDPDGDGVCWCAAISSIAAFRTQTNPLPSRTLYNRINSNYPGTPKGNEIYIPFGFEYYGLTHHYYSYGAKFDTVASIIRQRLPIYAGIASRNSAHAVVICGYQSAAGGYYYYTIMDPNYSSKITISVSSTAVDFTYASPDGTTYTSWKRRVH